MRRSTLLITVEESTGLRSDRSLNVDAIASDLGISFAQPKELKDASHGEIITLADGTSGWVIDPSEEVRRKVMASGVDQIMKLTQERDPLFDTFAVDDSRKVDARKALLGSGTKNYDIGQLIELQTQFSRYTYGPNGLINKNDPAAKDYAKKIEAVRSGRIRLPTVSEYERQLKELEEEKKEGANMNIENIQNRQLPQTPQQATQPPQAPIPEQPVAPPQEQRGRIIDPNASVVGVQALPSKKQEPAVVPAPTVTQPPVVNEPEVVAPAPQPRPIEQVQPINLARMQAEQKAAPAPEPTPEPVEQDPGIVIEVPAEEAPIFMATMPQELKDKVKQTAVLEVRAVVTTDVPVATRTIDTITEFKSLLPRKVVGNLVEKVLVNSGYIATVEGASSLDMATIAYDPSTEVPDYPKMIQFAYDHLVNTSIGQLTFPKFVQETSAQDIPVLIAAIYQASEPDAKSMMVQCGNPRCRDHHEIMFSVSNMWDTSEFDEATIEYFNEIINARDNIFQAREVHSRAPVMKVDFLQFDNMYFGIKHTDAEMAANYFPVAQSLATTYNSSVTVYVAFVKEVRINENGSTYASSAPEVICQALLNIRNDEGQVAIRNYIVDHVPEYKEYTFKMKPLNPGDVFTCKKCGHVDEAIPVRPETLVFRKASATGAF